MQQRPHLLADNILRILLSRNNNLVHNNLTHNNLAYNLLFLL
jgi:hypothetical protein